MAAPATDSMRDSVTLAWRWRAVDLWQYARLAQLWVITCYRLRRCRGLPTQMRKIDYAP